MARICGAVRNKLLLSPSTSDIRYSGHLFSRYETTSSKREAGLQGDYTHQHGLLERILKPPLKQLALASAPDNSPPGAALRPLQHGSPVPSRWECCRSHLLPTPPAATQTSRKPSLETGHTRILQFTEVIMAKASFP